MNFTAHARRSGLGLTTLALVATLGACDSLLDVQNPGQITEPKLNDPAFVDELANSPMGQFNLMYTAAARFGAILTDEAVNGHQFTEWKEIDLRQMREGNTVLTDIYRPVQRTRVAGEEMTARLKTLLGDAAATDVRVAKTLTYAGYGNVVLAEFFCEAPLGPTEAASTPAQIFERAVGQFEEALAIIGTAEGATETYYQNLARVGIARALLNLNRKAEAITYASQVPANFVAIVPHNEVDASLNNLFYDATTGSFQNIGVDERFRSYNDPRVPFAASSTLGHNQLTPLHTPGVPQMYGGHQPGVVAPFTKSSAHVFASGLEARHIVAEAQGPTAPTIAFINQRRLAGNPAATPLPADASAADIMAELRKQKGLDFYLSGTRLGDLRRYIAQQGVDLFPTGEHPAPTYGNYENATCFVPSRDEAVGNPNF
jgi:hypothetical protein